MALRLEKIKAEIQDERSELALYKIIPYPADYTLEGLHEKWKQENISIPEFQRQFVWTVLQASRLVESFLLGLPVPGIFFYKDPETGRLVVIDGQQRLRSVFSFFKGEWPGTRAPFRLREVQYQWEGRLFSDLKPVDQQRLKDAVLRATIVEQIDPKDNSSIFHIFERLNTGGTSLKPQEVRNCIYNGQFNDLLQELNSTKGGRNIVGSVRFDKRMKDVELILRFLALAQNADQYKKPMKNFLSDFMKKYRYAPKADLEKFRDLFTETMRKVLAALGKKPFHIRIGLNSAAYDSVMVAFAWSRKRPPSDLRKRYRELLKDPDYDASVSSSTTDDEVLSRRISIARKKLFGD